MHIRNLIPLLATSLALAGCFGGGSDDETPAPTQTSGSVPAEVMASVERLMAYASEMVSLGRDDAEALGLPAQAMPVSDTTEPVTLPAAQ